MCLFCFLFHLVVFVPPDIVSRDEVILEPPQWN